MSRKNGLISYALLVARRTAVTLAAVGMILPAGCDRNPASGPICSETSNLESAAAFVGALSDGSALLAVDLARCDGSDRLRIFVTDGSPDGRTEYFDGATTNGNFTLTSASGQAQIDGIVANDRVDGSIAFGGQAPVPFQALSAVDGAGLYEVTIDTDGVWTGTGPDGAILEARQDARLVNGVITDGAGQDHWYQLRDLSRIFSEPAVGGAPDTYLVIVLPHVDAQIGRGGAESLKAGVANASANFIRLDLPVSTITPGTFVGQFQDLPDLIGFEFDEPDASGNTHLRAFVCNGQPAPNGRAEWFSADFAGEFPDASFTLDSVSGNARITNLQLKTPPPSQPAGKSSRAMLRIQFCDIGSALCCSPGPACVCKEACPSSRGIAGTLELADGSRHAFYAVPAGEGAGIYEVKLEPGRMHGTSVKGGTLDFAIDSNGHVTGTLVAPDGTVVPYEGSDFGQAFSDPQKLASVPDTFVVLAAPRGRFLVGSPGTVHGLVVIAIIAILISPLLPAVQKCPTVNGKLCCECRK